MDATFRWAKPSRSAISVVQALASRPQPLHIASDEYTDTHGVTGPRRFPDKPGHQRHMELISLTQPPDQEVLLCVTGEKLPVMAE